MKQPEALRLADALMEPVVLDKHAMQAAAELRRLHDELISSNTHAELTDLDCIRLEAEIAALKEENERLYQINQSHEMKLSVRGYENQIADLKAVNEELLGALKAMLTNWQEAPAYGSDAADKARAAIAKAGGEA